ncbi:glutaredoxin family protein [Peribacillus cavernae]|uniref:Glutaredoxin family protein n=1 Tax=Peribacillus cavernae TaxID=1674310 RepID=A0A3S0U1F3_9BACI|nr:glutaredoxin family protein [Peribacillus cavernae]RUQ32117.1 glutaredoxin family protein [Peribacillus cavernae]
MQGELLLYSRVKCPLCDKAKDILDELVKEIGISYKEIDIYSDDDLIERFGLMIPVLEWQGEILQYGNIDKYGLLNRLQK